MSLNLREISATPEELLAKLDSMEKAGAYKEYEINYLRSYAYYALCKFNKASVYADSVLNSEGVRSDSTIMFRTLVIAAESCALSSRLMDAANMVSAALSYSRRVGDSDLEANMMYVQGIIWHRMGLYEKSYEIIENAISIFSSKPDIGSKLRISAILDTLSEFYIDSGLYEKAWQTCERRNHILKTFDGSDKISDNLLDRMYGVYFSKMAYLSLKMRRYIMADDFYLRYKATGMSGTLPGALEINPYLLLKGRYNDVIDNNKAFFMSTDNADTVSVVYCRSLLQSAMAYEGLKMYEQAYLCIDKYNAITESYRRNVDTNRLFELYKVIGNIKDDARIEAIKGELEYRQKLVIVLYTLIGVLVFLLVYILIERRKLKKKNYDISRLIVELNNSIASSGNEWNKTDNSQPVEDVSLHEAELLEETSANPDLFKMSNDDLFRRFDSIVKDERLYLDYNLQRDYYASLMGVDRNRFATIIKEATGGGNLSAYLNDMRLNYSITLFREHPEMSISEVGNASAIPNISTFYRLFKEKYGLSPKMFIEQLDSKKQI